MPEPGAYAKPLPQPTPASQPFWDGCRRHELLLQQTLHSTGVVA